MKKILLAGVGVLALGVASASAADLVRPRQQMPVKAPAYVPPTPLYDWTGFYAGINGGYGFGRSDFSAPFASGGFDAGGGLIGGTLGYNYQVNRIVFGVEGDMDANFAKGSAPCAGVICETKSDWLATLRGRVGYSFGRFMPYVTGGAAFGNLKTSISTVGSASDTKTGWTAGGGIEAKINGPWSAKLEYLHVDLGRGASIGGADASYHSDIVRVGLNYKF
jgi:outer membrane immunogenic protein